MVATSTDDEGNTMAAIYQIHADEGSRKSRRSKVGTPLDANAIIDG
jgi:hypothetical protein